MHFLIQTPEPQAYDEEIRALGSQLLLCEGWPDRPLHFVRNFQRILRESGPFDVIHSHPFLASGAILRLAASEGVPIRIAHSHSAVPKEKQSPLPRQIYSRLMRHWIWTYATQGLGCSEVAATQLFGEAWRHDPRFSILFYGIEMERFANLPATPELRASLQIPPDRKILGHIGRFVEVKNHAFLIELFASLLKSSPSYHLILVGHGPLFDPIKQQIERLGLSSFVSMVGLQSNVLPYLALMDLLLLPSFYEGLPVTLIEAQAASLPAIASSAVTKEVDVIDGLVERISLQEPLTVWEDAIRRKIAAPRPPHASCYQAMLKSPMNLQFCLSRLRALYEIPLAQNTASF